MYHSIQDCNAMPNIQIDHHALCSSSMDRHKSGDFEGGGRWNHILFTMLGGAEGEGDGTG
jgi:hypothetical protein